MSDITLGAGAGWGTTTVDCGVKYDVNVGRGEGGVSGVLMVCGTGMVQLIIAVIFFALCVLTPNESEGKLVLGSAKRAIMSPTD